MVGRILSRDAYSQFDPPGMARFFLGKTLCVRSPVGEVVDALICETEAYGGAEDRACHGYMNRLTNRTKIMFGIGGFSYVYLCYGLHRMFNIVTGPEGSPEAVLIRAVRVTNGHDVVKERRRGVREKEWTNGPGNVCTAMDIQLMHYGTDLTSNHLIWLEDRNTRVDPNRVITTPRIGIDYAGPIWSQMPWRFLWVG